MPRYLLFDDLDLSGIPPGLQGDEYWRRCIDLALCSRSENQRYGAIIVSRRKIIGEGRNRLLPKGEEFPFPTSFFLHAEKSAIGNAIVRYGEARLKGATLYVAGLLVKERRPLIRSARFKDANTCVGCTKHYVRYGLRAAFYTENGWVFCSGARAHANAVANSRLIRERGITPRRYRQEISI